jgi:hypothetical protein
LTTFKMYECDFGFTINGTKYEFDHVEGVTIEDPERTRIMRGANAKNTTGFVYVEGLKEAKTMTLTVIGMTAATHNLLKDAYKNKTRIEQVWVVSRADGSSKMAKNAVLSQSPKQLSMDDSAESLNTALLFESFDMDETHKT